MGTSFVHAGPDSALASATNTKCSDEIYDTGFYDVAQACEGQYVGIRQTAKGASQHGNWYTVSELRLYQVPNLMMVLSVKISAP